VRQGEVVASAGSRTNNKLQADTTAVVRRDPDEERRRTKQGLVREQAPRPARSSDGVLPSFSLAVGRPAAAPATADTRSPAAAAASAPAVATAPIMPAPAPSGVLDLSAPGDRLEREADEAAERVVRRLAVAPGGAGEATPPRPPEPPPAYARGLVVQRASLVEV